MKKNSSHRTKTVSERRRYNLAIGRTQTDSTLNEDFATDSTTKNIETKNEALLQQPRKIPIGDSISNYVRENWVHGLVLILLAFCGWLFLDSKITLSSINKDIQIQQEKLNTLSDMLDENDNDSEEQIQEIQNTLNDMKDKIYNTNEKNTNQDILINEIKIKLDLLIQEFNNNKEKSNP